MLCVTETYHRHRTKSLAIDVPALKSNTQRENPAGLEAMILSSDTRVQNENLGTCITRELHWRSAWSCGRSDAVRDETLKKPDPFVCLARAPLVRSTATEDGRALGAKRTRWRWPCGEMLLGGVGRKRGEGGGRDSIALKQAPFVGANCVIVIGAAGTSAHRYPFLSFCFKSYCDGSFSTLRDQR